jgi:hypothetical protein
MVVTQQRLSSARRVARVSVSEDNRGLATNSAGRLLRIALAIYLIPALLAVLAVGTLGMLVLAVSGCSPVRQAHGSARREEH